MEKVQGSGLFDCGMRFLNLPQTRTGTPKQLKTDTRTMARGTGLSADYADFHR